MLLQSYIYILPSICLLFQLTILLFMNYTENVTELLVHAQTVDTRRSSPQLPSARE